MLFVEGGGDLLVTAFHRRTWWRVVTVAPECPSREFTEIRATLRELSRRIERVEAALAEAGRRSAPPKK